MPLRSPAGWALAVSAGLLAFTWAGYPLLVGAMAALRPRRRVPRSPARTPMVSVVVATRDEPEAVAARVVDALAADYPADSLEVVVALDARAPFPPSAYAFADPRARVVAGDAPGGKTAALNAGVRAARGEVLVFTDTAQRFARDAVTRLVAALESGPWAVVSGALQLPGDADGRRSLAERYWRFERWLRRAEARVHSAVGVTGAIYAMPRRLWAPLPADLILDDVYVPMRLVLEGHRVGFAEEAVARDERRTAPGQEYRRKVRTLTGNIQLCAWLPAVLVPGRNPIWFQFLSHKLLRLLTPYLVLVAFGAGLWIGARQVPRPEMGGTGWAWLLLPLAAVAALPPLRRRLASAVHWFVVLQAAVVVATVNGVRGRWNVWRA